MSYHDRFDEILAEMSRLHSKKGADYGSGTDPYANVRASQEFGIPPWIGALVRLNDKITRLKSFIRNGNLQNESVEDSIRDIQVYAVIMQILYEEGNSPPIDADTMAGFIDADPVHAKAEPYCYCGDTRFGDHPGHPVHLKGYKPGETEQDKKGGLPMRYRVITSTGEALWLGLVE